MSKMTPLPQAISRKGRDPPVNFFIPLLGKPFLY